MEHSIIRTEYSELMQKSYIDYAMSVIIARALPDVRDGLKPVQRRTPVSYTHLAYAAAPEAALGNRTCLLLLLLSFLPHPRTHN